VFFLLFIFSAFVANKVQYIKHEAIFQQNRHATGFWKNLHTSVTYHQSLNAIRVKTAVLQSGSSDGIVSLSNRIVWQ